MLLFIYILFWQSCLFRCQTSNILKIRIYKMSTLRQQCKERLKMAFDSVRVVSNTLNFILVVDNYGLKVLSSTIKMMELINYGIVIVQRLQLKRKRYSKIEAVYLISPRSYELLLQDFPVDEPPQYKSFHVLSLSKIPPIVMEKMSQNISFSKRVKSLKQINFSFSLFNHNQAKICSYEENSFKKSLEGNNQFLQTTVEELTSIVTTMSSFYIVQIYYQKSSTSSVPQKIAFGLKQRFESLFKTFQKFSVPNYNNSAPLTTFLILDRSYDPVSPLIRDYHYGPLFYDSKNITNHKVTEFGKDKKTLTLNQNDQIMDKYKNCHISVALKGIPADFQQFSQSHATAKFQKNQGEGDLDMNKLTEVMKRLPQYMDVKDRYTLHYQALQQILESMQAKQLKQQGFVQQSVISLTNDDGKKIKEKDVFVNLIGRLDKTKNDAERAKLVLIGLMCLQLKPKEQSTLTDFLSKTIYEGIQKNLNRLSGLNVYHLNPKKQSKGNEILDRHLSKLQQTVRDISNQNHGDLKLLRVGADKSSKSSAKNQQGVSMGLKKIKVQNDKKDRPRMIVFMNSALGYNQMRALSEYENNFQMIYVSHNFVTPSQYLQLVNKLGIEEQELQL